MIDTPLTQLVGVLFIRLGSLLYSGINPVTKSWVMATKAI